MRAGRGLVAGLTAAALAAGGAGGASAAQSVGDEERAFRQEALGHAGAVASAYRRLEEHILLQSTAITTWAGSTPPATTGWLASWTVRGLRARYCDDTLLVYLDPQKLKGVGSDHRAVHAAPHAFVGEGEESRFPALHWLEGNVAKGGVARGSVTLPVCMTGDPLPSGRAALAGGVKDPFVHLRAGASYELRELSCPSGHHGPDPGIREAREVTWTEDGRGNRIGAKVFGTWQEIANMCRGDYSDWEYFTRECTWTAGRPHNREMTGEEVWKRRRTVTAAGTVLGTPVLESSSCWEGEELAKEAEDTPTITEVAQPESMTVACGQGFTGTRRYERTKTTRSTQFRWDSAPVVSVRYTSWSQTSSSCAPVVEPPKCDPNVEKCEGTGCDPLVDTDCGKQVGGPDPKSADPKPSTRTVDVDLTRTRQCPSPMTGTYVQTQTCRYTYELSADGTRTQVGDKACGVWWMSVDNCKPPPGKEPFQPPGPGNPGGGSCGPPGDGSASPGDGPCTGMDGSIAAAVAAATGSSGGSGSGGCYFTTAVVELRGEEPDDGPTLTALREFRDTYMMETPLRRAMVRAYYAIAPLVVRDLPADDPSWKPMGGHIERSVALIRDGDLKGAFRAYVTGSARLMLRWWWLRAQRALS